MGDKKAVVALSGGKDSTAAVLLLKKTGHQVSGVNMALGLPGDDLTREKLKNLCSVLQIPLHILDLNRLFDRHVRQPFAGSYLAGTTPNPCALCNREIKFGRFMKEALAVSGADFMATGHYADIAETDGRLLLKEPVEGRKSQIYFMSLIDPGVLHRVRFPLAKMTVDEVRAMTRDLPLVNRQESQDVCFLGGEKLAGYLARELDPGMVQGGEIIDTEGKVIGRHQGLHHYTIGQRRGVGHAGGSRLYVVAKEMATNRLQLGPEEMLLTRQVDAVSPVYWRPLTVGEHLAVKIRYQTPARFGRVTRADENGFSLQLDEAVTAVTPGQIAVLYQGDCIVAGGEIEVGKRL